MDSRVIIAIILIVIVVAAVGNRGVQPPSGQSRRSGRDQRDHRRYHTTIKPAHQVQAKKRAKERREAALKGIAGVWQPRIDAENRRAMAAARRAERRMNAGRNSSKATSAAARHDRKAAEHSGHLKKELSFMQRLWDSASSGDRKAQNLIGKVHPKTGHTHGGVGREGHKPAHHMPPERKPKNGGKK